MWRWALPSVLRLTHADMVKSDVPKLRVEGVATVTCWPVSPLNERALPYLPRGVQAIPVVIAPVWPLPERSARAVPVPSLKAYESTLLEPVWGVLAVAELE